MARNTSKRQLPARQGVTLFAYADETGNTGYNLFDSAQPTFWTGTLVSTSDLDAEGTTFLEEACRSVGAVELHGSQLSFSGLEKISPLVKTFIVSNDCEFIFTRLDKSFLAATKLTDTLLDSTSNKAVTSLHYFSLLRGLLEMQLIPLMTFGNRKEFWVAYEKRDCQKFVKILELLQMRVIDRVRDERTKELLLDALSWGIRYPEQILIAKRSDWDSPNLIAFMSLVDEVRKVADERKSPQIKMFHDEQGQFGASIKWTFGVMKDIEQVEKRPFLISLNRRQSSRFKTPIELISSKVSVGLQVVDLALWLTKRLVESEIPTEYVDVLDLEREIIKRSRLTTFNMETYQEKIETAFRQIMNIDLTPEQEEKARTRMREREHARLMRMVSGPMEP